MPDRVLHLTDEDTGESKMDVVPVPEGFSLQLWQAGEEDYRSIIIKPFTGIRLAYFLAENVPKRFAVPIDFTQWKGMEGFNAESR